ncbi:MAG: DUF3467 domain-containing protein [Phycisphaera sp.]|nr:DUF3467 domain-containing protein [Phycisphaera sp.]
MAKDKNDDKTTPESAEHATAGAGDTVSAPAEQTPPRGAQLRLDESNVQCFYSSTTRLSGSAEEITIDFAQGIRPVGPNAAVLKIDARVVMSPWGAKRLVQALEQTVARYEQAYGVLETDPRKRIREQPGATTSAR